MVLLQYDTLSLLNTNTIIAIIQTDGLKKKTRRIGIYRGDVNTQNRNIYRGDFDFLKETIIYQIKS